jgi:O-antigen/teichoic acid export membrane protein
MRRMPAPDRTTHSTGGPPTLIAQLGRRLGRDSLIYASGTVVAFPVGLIGAIVLTRFLSPTEFGRLAVLLVSASLMTLLLSSVILRGVISLAFRGGDDLGSDSDAPTTADPRRALTTGVVLTALVSAAAGGLVALFAEPIGELLLDDPAGRAPIVWAGASGALGAVWRLTSNIIRMERHAVTFAVVNCLRPLLVLGATISFVAVGLGVTGAIAGTAVGTALALVAAVAVSIYHRTYSASVAGADVRSIMRRGAPMAGVIVGVWAMHELDVLVLASVVPKDEVGLYRLASRLSAILSYAVSAFMLAWTPLEGSTLFAAAYERHGRARVRGAIVFYYLVGTFSLLLLLAATARPLMSVLTPGYEDAASFVAITAAGFIALGLFVLTARASQFARRYVIYTVAALLGGATVAAVGLPAGDWLGGYGVAIGNIAGGLLATGIIVVASIRSGSSPSIDARRTACLVVATGACWVLVGPVAERAGAWQIAVILGGLALWLALVLATGLIPGPERGVLSTAIRGSLRGSAPTDHLTSAARRLAPLHQRALLTGLTHVKGRRGRTRGTPLDPALRAGLVGGLRELTGKVPSGPGDAEIGAYLTANLTVAERDKLGRYLMGGGTVGAEELFALESAFSSLERIPTERWFSELPNQGAVFPSPPWQLDAGARELLERALRPDGASSGAGEPGTEGGDVERRVVACVRSLTGLGPPQPTDRLIGMFLLSPDDSPPAAQLWAAGVDPLELHRLELAVQTIATMPQRRWLAAAEPSGPSTAGAENGNPPPGAVRQRRRPRRSR